MRTSIRSSESQILSQAVRHIIYTVRKLETVHKLPVITVWGFDFTCFSHNPNILKSVWQIILLLKVSLSVSQLKSFTHTKIFWFLTLVNSPTQSSDFNLLNSPHGRHSNQHEITVLILDVYVYTCFSTGKMLPGQSNEENWKLKVLH